MTLYPPPPSDPNPPSYEAWLNSNGIASSSALGYFDIYGYWVPWTGEWYGPFYHDDGNGNVYLVDYYGGYDTPYGFLSYYQLEGYGFGYGSYETTIFARHHVHVPVMDHMGNVSSVVRLKGEASVGTSAQTEFVYDYDAFGKEIRSSSLISGSNPDSYPFHYSTKFTDAETGLVYYGYRFYDPNNGRWINRDPIEESGGLNLYEMTRNNPINCIDILGNATLVAGAGAGAAAGSVVPGVGTAIGAIVGLTGAIVLTAEAVDSLSESEENEKKRAEAKAKEAAMEERCRRLRQITDNNKVPGTLQDWEKALKPPVPCFKLNAALAALMRELQPREYHFGFDCDKYGDQKVPV
jgi:RHS repeat-associated protein